MSRQTPYLFPEEFADARQVAMFGPERARQEARIEAQRARPAVGPPIPARFELVAPASTRSSTRSTRSTGELLDVGPSGPGLEARKAAAAKAHRERKQTSMFNGRRANAKTRMEHTASHAVAQIQLTAEEVRWFKGGATPFLAYLSDQAKALRSKYRVPVVLLDARGKIIADFFNGEWHGKGWTGPPGFASAVTYRGGSRNPSVHAEVMLSKSESEGWDTDPLYAAAMRYRVNQAAKEHGWPGVMIVDYRHRTLWHRGWKQLPTGAVRNGCRACAAAANPSR